MGRNPMGAFDVPDRTDHGSTLGGLEERAGKADQGVDRQRQLVWAEL